MSQKRNIFSNNLFLYVFPIKRRVKERTHQHLDNKHEKLSIRQGSKTDHQSMLFWSFAIQGKGKFGNYAIWLWNWFCVSKKKHKTQHGEPLNANQRRTVCHSSDYMFRANLTASSKAFSTHHFWSVIHYQFTSTCLIYRPRGIITAQSQGTTVYHSGSAQEAGQLNHCGKGNSLLGG